MRPGLAAAHLTQLIDRVGDGISAFDAFGCFLVSALINKQLNLPQIFWACAWSTVGMTWRMVSNQDLAYLWGPRVPMESSIRYGLGWQFEGYQGTTI